VRAAQAVDWQFHHRVAEVAETISKCSVFSVSSAVNLEKESSRLFRSRSSCAWGEGKNGSELTIETGPGAIRRLSAIHFKLTVISSRKRRAPFFRRITLPASRQLLEHRKLALTPLCSFLSVQDKGPPKAQSALGRPLSSGFQGLTLAADPTQSLRGPTSICCPFSQKHA
jgi:hypothetical protein